MPLVLSWLRTPSLYYCHELPRRLYEGRIYCPYTRSGRMRILADKIDPLPPLNRILLKFIDRHNARRATRIAVNSHFTWNNVRLAYKCEASICPPGVAAGKFQPKEQKREGFVLSVGALTPMKGFDFLVESLSTLPVDERPRLIIVSNYQEPAELLYLQTLAEQYAVNLTCYCNLSDEELLRLYVRAGCVAYAPVREPFGLVAIEAMAAGAPLVGVNEGGVCETIVDGQTGILAHVILSRLVMQ